MVSGILQSIKLTTSLESVLTVHGVYRQILIEPSAEALIEKLPSISCSKQIVRMDMQATLAELLAVKVKIHN